MSVIYDSCLSSDAKARYVSFIHWRHACTIARSQDLERVRAIS